MSDYGAFIKTIKRIALEAVEASRPVNVCFGKVTSASPLKIQVDQKMILDKDQLILCKTVTDPKLKKGDELVLIRQQGGQQYVVIDRMV